MRIRILSGLLASSLMAGAASAQELTPGTVIAKVVCRESTGQSYALYLPSTYSSDRKWPILYAFDSGARGLIPVERFKEAAERLGFIVAGSNNSRNGPLQVAQDALIAVLNDTLARFSLEPRRLYVAGYSGGARVSVMAAMALPGQVAGVIGFGAGFPPAIKPSASLPFAFFGAAGTDDFNYPELVQLDQSLERLKLPHRFEVFEGAHEWPPEAVCARALEWMELQAMKSGIRPRDAALLEQLFARTLAAADADNSSGRLYHAWARYTALAVDFVGLRDVAVCRQKARDLERAAEVKQMAADLDRSIERQWVMEGRIVELVKQAGPGQTGAQARADLLEAVRETKQLSGDATPRADRMAARRTLTSAWVQLDEAAAADVARGQLERAAIRYQVMAQIRPESPRAEYNLACVLARSGSRKAALDALRRAIDKGFADATLLKTDHDLDTLRNDAAFRLMLEALERK